MQSSRFLVVPEASLPACYREHFDAAPARAREEGSHYRAPATAPRFRSSEVTFLPFPNWCGWGTVALSLFMGASFVSPSALLLVVLPQPDARLRLFEAWRDDRSTMALAYSLIALALLGGVLLLRFAVRAIGDLRAVRAGRWRWGLYLFPDGLVVRTRAKRGCLLLPREEIIDFSYASHSSDPDPTFYVAARLRNGALRAIHEPEAYQFKGGELAEELNRWLRGGA